MMRAPTERQHVQPHGTLRRAISPGAAAPPRRRQGLWPLLALLALSFLIAPKAEAGAPPLRDTYRDPVHKFSLRIFRDYKPVPLQPDERTTACRFRDPKDKGGARGTFPVTVEVLRIVKDGKDKPVVTGAEEGGPPTSEELREAFRRLQAPTDVFEAAFGNLWIPKEGKDLIEKGKSSPEEIRSKDKIMGKAWSFELPSVYGDDDSSRLFVYLAAFEQEGVEYGISCSCGASMRKNYEPRFEDIAQSFMFFDDRAKDVESLDVLDGINISAKRRLGIEKGMVKGWDVIVSPKKNYIIIYNTKKGTNNYLAKVIAERIEMIREQIYEVQFPPAKPITKVCIVRVCEDARDYHSYGGPGGSAGYWSPMAEELVFYDASASKKPDDDTLSVLYHEAFHQYIHYSVGEVAPHSWFNEGHGDYYAGAKLKGKKFVIGPFQWRVGTIKGAIVQGVRPFTLEKDDESGKERKVWEPKGYTPLQDLVNFSQGEYYSYPGVCYAQGWSLIYFLREEVQKNKKYREKWGHILDTYFNVLKAEVNRETPLVPGSEKVDPEAPDTDEDDDADGGDRGDGGDEGAPPKEDEPAPPPPPPGGDGEGGGGPADGEEPPAGNFEAARPTYQGFGSENALRRAVEEAFKGVDWEEFEAAWRKATK